MTSSKILDLLLDVLVQVEIRVILDLLLSNFVEPLGDFKLLLKVIHLSQLLTDAFYVIAHLLRLSLEDLISLLFRHVRKLTFLNIFESLVRSLKFDLVLELL